MRAGGSSAGCWRGQIGAEGAILRNYKDALKFLQMVADGTFSLGAEDPIANNPMLADVRFDADENVFNRQQLRSFR